MQLPSDKTRHPSQAWSELCEQLPVGIYEYIEHTDGRGETVFVSDRCLSMLGISRSRLETSFDAALDNVPSEDRERIMAENLRHTPQHGPFTTEFRVLAGDQQRWLRLESRPRALGENTLWSGVLTDITDMRASQERFRVLFDDSPVAIFLHDAESGEILNANRRAWQEHGYDSLEAMLDNPQGIWLEPPHDHENALKMLHHAARHGRTVFEWPTGLIHDRRIWHEVTLTPVTIDGRACVLAVCVNITQRHESEQQLRESEARFRKLLQEVRGIAVQGCLADGTVHYWNQASEELYGYSAEEAIGGNLLELIAPERTRPMLRQILERVAHGGDLENAELELMRKDGSRLSVYSSHTAVRQPGRAPELFCLDIDLTERKRYESNLARLANHDTLTGLPNRHFMGELLREMIARADRHGRSLALCYLDLDLFKPINDQYGHATGDAVLLQVAHRLKKLVRSSDAVARLGGDEFVLLLEEVTNLPQLQRMLERILDQLARPIHVGRLQLQVHASIGVTLYPEDHADADILLRHADQAMYQAKSQGRNRFSIFDPSLESSLQQRRQRLLALEQALEREEFVLHYQPKIDMRSGQMVGMEGLVRWQHPEQGLLPPSAFLSDLAGSDLEVRLGERVMCQALEQLARWTAAGWQLPLSINIAGPHLLQPCFTDRLRRMLARHRQLPRGMLVLEILESAALENLQRAIEVLQLARELGVESALDDFGTGYSSLSHLRLLPVDEVKIDQSFIRDMLDDANDLSIVRSVIGLAQAFDIRVVAEGVESAEHAHKLLEMGCHLGQGFAFARPMPPGTLERWRAHGPAVSGECS